ncbi:5-dehydro-4-deoxy-D-glucuronate isomerase [Psychrosphaera sp. B3R10]|uniref:5-dehydro-4-deoxy-D-glucuronate isomerase n=1 Tax=unclassified Psychrosphaera TaxID=2641570 RepID=UPI001C08B2CE|nr:MULTISPECIES: 5-dehydro-4-deoxy-D-glucuronate isomerase [unclassified Psychrosphaera]MBU2881045.1 5-dehydro-4-deoxy-D-glucuronate isomerase [Psychrosphaera sp. I2R16]MBU2989969.1 5-dehydro-4-deoxy-D-glucuronate isomerase [Psychrosphaera sp. B3R10]MDO6719139.1 5-dehydro-4-deoxy-D-glucuronate isomerase [Psychrosphaera sp. 1_MG-2023]
MKNLHTADIVRYKTMTNEQLKDSFTVNGLFKTGELNITYTDIDRGVVGGVVPVNKAINLPVYKELAADYFCQRREVGIINIGAIGSVTIDGTRYTLNNRDSLYIGRGSVEISFESNEDSNPAKFYLISYPAHQSLPTKLVTKDEANKLELGASATCNERTIYQSICPGVADSCQLVMGFTELAEGSVWNTNPPHTHARRSEIYMYFDVPKEEVVFHLMGEPTEIKSMVMAPETAVVSPSWSIHSGVGTAAYTFIWAMGGENQEFSDMDHLKLSEIK